MEEQAIVGKVTWYRKSNRKRQGMMSNNYHDPERSHANGHRGSKRKREVEPAGSRDLDICGVIFVDHTPGSHLAKILREEECKLSGVTGYKVKVIEKAGDRLDRLLIRSDNKEGSDCERADCRLCWTKRLTGKKKRQSCTRRNLTYRGECLLCGGDDGSPKAEYIGETGADMFTRGRKHHQLWMSGSENSWSALREPHRMRWSSAWR